MAEDDTAVHVQRMLQKFGFSQSESQDLMAEEFSWLSDPNEQREELEDLKSEYINLDDAQDNLLEPAATSPVPELSAKEPVAGVLVVDYDERWPTVFEQIRAPLWDAVKDVAKSIEHVGSTSVPGLAAKPVIDITIVVEDRLDIASVIERLGRIGYRHRGDLGVEGREAFSNPPEVAAHEHNLYLCASCCASLRNHLAVRDRLRSDPQAATDYGDLKKKLALSCPDVNTYCQGKTEFIMGLLAESDALSADELDRIQAANLRK